MLDDLDLGLPSFGDTYINPQNGQRYPEFRLPKTLTTTLVSGYSTKLRYRIVKRWEELEGQAVPAPAFQLPQSFSEALRLAAEQAEQIEQHLSYGGYADTYRTLYSAVKHSLVRACAAILFG